SHAESFRLLAGTAPQMPAQSSHSENLLRCSAQASTKTHPSQKTTQIPAADSLPQSGIQPPVPFPSSDSRRAPAPSSPATSHTPPATARPAVPRSPFSSSIPRNTRQTLFPALHTVRSTFCTSPPLPPVHESNPQWPAPSFRALFVSRQAGTNLHACSSNSIHTPNVPRAPSANQSLPRISCFLLRIKMHSSPHSSWPKFLQLPPATPAQNPDETSPPAPAAVPFRLRT